jgi:hypothetical protein
MSTRPVIPLELYPDFCLWCGVPLNRGNSLCSRHATAQASIRKGVRR